MKRNFNYPLSRETAMVVHYARHSTWAWLVCPQPMGYETHCLNVACRGGIVFG